MKIQKAFGKIIEKVSLSEQEAYTVMMQILSDEATPSQSAAYLTALRMKGETLDEVVGSTRALKNKAISMKIEAPFVVDTCGTGGDGRRTFNISTAVAFVIAGAGITVAKHGNKSASGLCGSADVLEALGVNIRLAPQRVKDCIHKIGIGFLYAPLYHTALKSVAQIRKEIGFRTLFNILGPLLNPANVNVQLVGVPSEKVMHLVAGALRRLKTKHYFVVRGLDGLDELTLTASSKVCEGRNGECETYRVTPYEVGLQKSPLEAFQISNVKQSAKIIMDILSSREKGARRDIVLLNAAPLLIACGKARNLRGAVHLAKEILDSRKALEKLKQLKEFSTRYA